MSRSTLGLVLSAVVVCTFAASAAPAWAVDTVSSPLDSAPAHFEYVTNNAPFVVFDIAPRTLNGAAAVKGFKELELTFVATDALQHVDVYTYVVAPGGKPQELPARIACGSKIAGHHSCKLPTRDALLLLKGGPGTFGLRVEAEGIEGDQSTVRITLPVKAGGGKPVPAKVTSPLPLTLLAY